MTSRPASASPPPASLPSGAKPVPNWEWGVILLLLAVFVAAGINNDYNFAFIGQDFSVHLFCTRDLILQPDHWYSFDYTNRPVPYWIGILCHDILKGPLDKDLSLAGCVFVVLNALALLLLHASSRRFIASPLLRISAFAFVAFLPSTMVTSVVYAADAVAQLPFAFAAWSLIRSTEATTTRSTAIFAGLAGLALWLGNLAKYTFIVMPAAVVLVLILLRWWNRISWRQAAIIGALAVLPPLLAGYMIDREAKREVASREDRHTFDWAGTEEMTWNDVLYLKRSDTRIFEAPGYWDPPPVTGPIEYGGLPLLDRRSYSYPALFHLGIYTDVLDYANQGSFDNGVPRPEPQKKFSRLAVWLGLPFSVGLLVTTIVFWLRNFLALFRARIGPSNGALVWGAMALTWYLPLVLVLPYIHNAYVWGYWLPRLVIPSLWGFALVLFATADEVFAQRRTPAVILTVFVLLEAAVHLRSVWY
jgi:4-amino-4-deoxy-L-arabinose transferase-like glycosyltransferase